MDPINFKPSPLDFPDRWTRGDSIGPLTVVLEGRDLTDCLVTLTFRVGDEDGDIVQVCCSDPEKIVGDGSEITLTPAENRARVEPWEPNTAGKLAYDMELRWPDGNPKVRTPYKGTWRLEKDVTR